jgi:hypothetical protein
MRNTMVKASRALAVLAGSLSGLAAPAQAPLPVSYLPSHPVVSKATPAPEAAKPPAGAGRIEVYDGPQRTVHYVAPDLSPGEQAALSDLARTENEAAYADELLALKRSYVDSELLLEPYRRSIQQQLYGYSTTSTYSGYVSSGGYYPYVGWSGYGYGGDPSYFGGATTTVSRSLANGVGYEGPLKDAMARKIAADAGPEYADGAARAKSVALGRIAGSERLAKSFNLTGSNVVPAAAISAPHITLTLKSGEKVDGTLYGEDADWFRVDTASGTVSVRKADVNRVEMPKK